MLRTIHKQQQHMQIISFVDDTYRRPKEEITGIPPIPAQPIGFEDAESLIW